MMKVVTAFWVVSVAVILLDIAFIAIEKYRISKMEPVEKIEYLIKKYGKDYTEHL